MRERVRFSKATIEAMKPGDYRDDNSKYLLLRVGKETKTFYYVRKVDGRTPYIKIGRYPDMPVSVARKRHDEISGQIAIGNPAAPPKSRPIRFGEIYEKYMREHMEPKRRSAGEDERRYNLYLKQWERTRADRITQAIVSKLHIQVGTTEGHPVAANRIVEHISRIYNYAIRHGSPDLKNPTDHITKYPERRRRRFLRAGELKALFSAIKGERAANEALDVVYDANDFPSQPRARERGPASPIALDCIEVLLWTGQRKATVMSMRFDQVDIDAGVWRLPKGITKTGEEQVIVLGPAAEIIQRRHNLNTKGSPYVFPGRYGKGHIKELRYSWATLLMRAGLQDVTIHDLRRTLGSWLAGTGGNLRTIQEILGHSSISATRIYTELDLAPMISAHNTATAAMLDAINDGS